MFDPPFDLSFFGLMTYHNKQQQQQQQTTTTTNNNNNNYNNIIDCRLSKTIAGYFLMVTLDNFLVFKPNRKIVKNDCLNNSSGDLNFIF